MARLPHGMILTPIAATGGVAHYRVRLSRWCRVRLLLGMLVRRVLRGVQR